MSTRSIIRFASRPPMWIAVIAMIAVCGCAYALVQNGNVNQTETARVERGLEKLRGLYFTRNVPVVVKTRDQAERMLMAQLKSDHTDEDFRISGESGSMVGLYPAGIDLKAQTEKLLHSQIAGFYDPNGRQMVLVKGVVDRGLLNKASDFVSQQDTVDNMLLAHELTHALQDQHFKIESMLDRVEDSNDRTLALKSVAEGDATLAGFGYVAGGLDQKKVDSIVARLADLPVKTASKNKSMPVGLIEPLMFEYSAGVRFVAEAYERGGWPAVNALYRNPPLSTQQIMEPALYFDRFSPPAKINVAGYHHMMPGWNQVDEDNYGEMLLKIIFQRNLGRRAPELAVLPRWDGDKMIVLKKGNDLAVVWMVAMRDEASAEAFANAYRRILTRMRSESEPYRVECRDSTVLIVIGKGIGNFRGLSSSIWKASTIVRVLPPLSSHRASLPTDT